VEFQTIIAPIRFFRRVEVKKDRGLLFVETAPADAAKQPKPVCGFSRCKD
jgi:hypothetical protein